MAEPPRDLLERFSISAPEPVAETGLARLWKVRRAGGGHAALKKWHDASMANERPGVGYLAERVDHGAVEIYGQCPGAVVMEWLEGPSLGDVARAGNDREAAEILCSVALRLRSRPPAASGVPLVSEADWCKKLFRLDFAATLPRHERHLIERARSVLRHLLARAEPVVALHGDLHHDNIRKGPRGWTAFDAKGIAGPPAYEFANAFRHPRGAPDMVRDAQRALMLASLWAPAAGVDARDLLGWAAAKLALSIAWRNGEALSGDPELPLLGMWLDLAGAR